MSGLGAIRILRLALVVAVAGSLALATFGHPGPLRLAVGLVILYVAPWIATFIRAYPATRPITVRFLACTFAIALGFGVFELPALFGLIDYRRTFHAPTLSWERPGNRADLGLLYVKKGYERIRESFTGNETPWLRDLGPLPVYQSDRQHDNEGFRNSRDLDHADVVLIGDSFIEGAHVTEADLVSTRLAQQLGGQKTVLNLGQAGYGPVQESYLLQRYGLPKKPAVCLWAFYEGNDLADIDEYNSQRKVLVSKTRSFWGVNPSIAERSFTANALGYLLRTWIDPPPRRPASQYRGWFTNDQGERIPLYFASGDYRREAALPASLDPLRKILTDARDECREQNARLVVVFIPTKLRVYRSFCQFEPGSVCEKWPIDDLPKVLGCLVSGISPEITYLDLTPHFQAEAARGALLYLSDDTHWTADGHYSAARAITEAIIPLFPAPASLQR